MIEIFTLFICLDQMVSFSSFSEMIVPRNVNWYYSILSQITRNTKVLLCKYLPLKWNQKATAINGQKTQVKEIHLLDILLRYLSLFPVECSYFLLRRKNGFINLGRLSVEFFSVLEVAFEKVL